MLVRLNFPVTKISKINSIKNGQTKKIRSISNFYYKIEMTSKISGVGEVRKCLKGYQKP